MPHLIDATEGVTEQDTKVAGLAHEAGKACIIVVNKWDAIEKDDKTMDKMRQEVRNGLAFMTYAPILFISAKTGQRVDRLFELIDYVSNQASTRITTGMLNSVLADAQTRVQPPFGQGSPAEDLLYHAGRRQAAAFCLLLQRQPSFPFLLPAVSGELPAEHLWPGGHAYHPLHPPAGREGGVRMGAVVWFLISRMELWLVAAIAYFCGCFNGAVIISKYILRDDVRRHGSGNAGLTNFTVPLVDR